MSYVSDIINSMTTTGIAEIMTLPICTLKTNYQNTNQLPMSTVAKNIYNNGGIMAFYRASPAAIGSQIFSTSSKYFLYRFLENKQYPYTNKVFNGMIAGLISSLMTHPIDSIKIHLQMNSSFIEAVKKNGPMLFYRGYSKSFTKTLVSSSLFFPYL